MARIDGRAPNALREIKIIRSPQKDPEGSVLVEWGHTQVLCSATVEEKIPKWMNGSEDKGWITAEYGMLPGSTNKRINRDRARNTGRTHEIQRLIGRSIRAAVSLSEIGRRTVQLDCDVLQADGGTRVAAITGANMALYLACNTLVNRKKLSRMPDIRFVSAVSVGRVAGELLLDLNYQEDSRAEVDANIVMNDKLEFIELQGTAEKGSFTRAEWDQLMDLASAGCKQIFDLQRKTLQEWKLLA